MADAYTLAASILGPSEHLKIALVANVASHAGNEGDEAKSQRIFVIVSNVAQGTEQACILVVKPRNRRPDTAVLLKVIPILPDLQIETDIESGSSSFTSQLAVSSRTMGLPSVQSILEIMTQPKATSSTGIGFSFAYGTQKANGSTSDTQGLKDFLTVLRDLLKVAEQHSFSLVTTHQWLSAYTDDVPSLHLNEPMHAASSQTPVFSRFTSSAFASHENKEPPRPESPSSNEIRVSTGTFNVNGHLPNVQGSAIVDLKKWLKAEEDPDLIVIGLQEADTSSGAYLYYSSVREEAWTRAAFDAMGRYAGQYCKVASKQLVGLLILVFSRLSLRNSITNIATATASVGFGGFIANKGAVGVRLEIGQRTLCFVNSHLAAFEGAEAMERRCWDWTEIYKRMRFKVAIPALDFWETPTKEPTSSPISPNPFQTVHDASTHTVSARAAAADRKFERTRGDNGSNKSQTIDQLVNDAGHMKLDAGMRGESTSDSDEQSDGSMDTVEYAITDHDVIINFGDLNFRIDLSHSEAHRLIAQKELRLLYRFDQLESLRTSHTLFDKFDEGRIDFAPTYKFDKGTDRYDTSEKLRVPAWTDRILWSVTQDWPVNDHDAASTDPDKLDSKERERVVKQRRQGVVLQSYESVPEVRLSDHKPVRATFLVRIQ